MIRHGERCCPKCGGELSGYDHVKRKIRVENGERQEILIKRFKCKRCGTIHSELPDTILPYKQYRADIVKGFQAGKLSTANLDYENYPCELTVERWKKRP